MVNIANHGSCRLAGQSQHQGRPGIRAIRAGNLSGQSHEGIGSRDRELGPLHRSGSPLQGPDQPRPTVHVQDVGTHPLVLPRSLRWSAEGNVHAVHGDASGHRAAREGWSEEEGEEGAGEAGSEPQCQGGQGSAQEEEKRQPGRVEEKGEADGTSFNRRNLRLS